MAPTALVVGCTGSSQTMSPPAKPLAITEANVGYSAGRNSLVAINVKKGRPTMKETGGPARGGIYLLQAIGTLTVP